MINFIPIPIFLSEEKKCIIQEGIRYCQESSLPLGGLGLLLLIVVFWCIGWIGGTFYFDDKFGKGMWWLVGYLIATALLLILLG
jgi:hypothetical protein